MKVAVIGAGTMGSGIAQAFAQCSEVEKVYLCDIKVEFAEGGFKKIKAGLDKQVSKGKIEQAAADTILGKFECGLNTIAVDPDLVVEAALEVMDIKGAGLSKPIIGMHFFNPAPVMKLVEVIAGINTPAEYVDKVNEISEKLGKVPVQVNEAAGFVVNRILIPMINEAINVKYTGVSDIAGIDTAMKLGCNHPMGPLELGDFIGLDICLAIMDVIYADTGDNKYAASPLLRKMVRGKRLGVKTGIGFYDYSAGPRNKVATDK